MPASRPAERSLFRDWTVLPSYKNASTLLGQLFRRQWNRLTVIVEHIFNHHVGVIDLDDLVFTFHNIALLGDEHCPALIGQKNSLRFVRFAGEAIKLQSNRWRRRCGRRGWRA